MILEILISWHSQLKQMQYLTNIAWKMRYDNLDIWVFKCKYRFCITWISRPTHRITVCPSICLLCFKCVSLLNRLYICSWIIFCYSIYYIIIGIYIRPLTHEYLRTVITPTWWILPVHKTIKKSYIYVHVSCSNFIFTCILLKNI